MNVDVRIYLPDRKLNELLSFMRLFGKSNKEKSPLYTTMNYIHFNFHEPRTLTAHHAIINREKDIKKWNSNNVDSVHYVEKGLPDNTYGLLCSMDLDEASTKIMKMICYYFGGYIDEDDTDVDFYYEIQRNYHALIANLFN